MGYYIFTIFFLLVTCVFFITTETSSEDISSVTSVFDVNGTNHHVGEWSANLDQIEVKVKHETLEPSSDKTGYWNFRVQHESGTSHEKVSKFQELIDLANKPVYLHAQQDEEYGISWGSKEYKYHGYLSSWPDAVEICASEGATLATIVNEIDAQNLIEAVLNFKPPASNEHSFLSTKIWLGYYRLNQSFMSLYNTELEYNKLSPGYGILKADCLVLNQSYELEDSLCLVPHPFICEKLVPQGQKSLGKTSSGNDLKKKLESGGVLGRQRPLPGPD